VSELPSNRVAAWRAFLWAHALILQRFRSDLREQGLPIEEFDVLIHLYEAPTRRLPLSALAGSMVLGGTLTRSGLTRLLDRMESAGLVKRHLNRDDRRRFDVALTPRGARRFQAVWPDHLRGIGRYFSEPLGEDDVEALAATLAKLIESNPGKR